jgi:hypothetical protein
MFQTFREIMATERAATMLRDEAARKIIEASLKQCDVCERMVEETSRCFAAGGIETFACEDCRDAKPWWMT